MPCTLCGVQRLSPLVSGLVSIASVSGLENDEHCSSWEYLLTRHTRPLPMATSRFRE